MRTRSLGIALSSCILLFACCVVGCSDEALPGYEKEHGEDDVGDIPGGSNRGQDGPGTAIQDGSTSSTDDSSVDSGDDSGVADSGSDSETDSGIDDSGTDGS